MRQLIDQRAATRAAGALRQHRYQQDATYADVNPRVGAQPERRRGASLPPRARRTLEVVDQADQGPFLGGINPMSGEELLPGTMLSPSLPAAGGWRIAGCCRGPERFSSRGIPAAAPGTVSDAGVWRAFPAACDGGAQQVAAARHVARRACRWCVRVSQVQSQ